MTGFGRKSVRPSFLFSFLLSALLLLGSTVLPGFGQDRDLSEASRGLSSSLKNLLPLHTALGEPKQGEWRHEFDEPDQSFAQYLASRPMRVDARRKVIYVQPLGDFDEIQHKILSETVSFLGAYFQLPVKVREGLSLDILPASAQRNRADLGWKQLLTTHVLNHVLRPKLPPDACAYIALTTSDLWPGRDEKGKEWNFVFGQASITDRVGVWSIKRNGDPHDGEAAYGLCLRRTLKTATHETCHMFSMAHCTFYRCNMCGSNSLAEADRQPLWLCPICLGKLCHATGADPAERFKALIEFSKKHGLKAEQVFWEKSAAKSKE